MSEMETKCLCPWRMSGCKISSTNTRTRVVLYRVLKHVVDKEKDEFLALHFPIALISMVIQMFAFKTASQVVMGGTLGTPNF